MAFLFLEKTQEDVAVDRCKTPQAVKGRKYDAARLLNHTKRPRVPSVRPPRYRTSNIVSTTDYMLAARSTWCCALPFIKLLQQKATAIDTVVVGPCIIFVFLQTKHIRVDLVGPEALRIYIAQQQFCLLIGAFRREQKRSGGMCR